MTEPDIIENFPNGIIMTTIIQAIEITRQGKNESWRISLPLIKEITLPDASIVSQSCAPVSYDLADLAYDPAVQSLYVQLRDVTIRIARGDLKPLSLVGPT